MKVLQVNCMYKKGSTGKIVYDIHNKLIALGHDDYVLYGRGKQEGGDKLFKFCYEIEAHLHHICVKYLGALRYGGNYFPTQRLIKAIERKQPDIVHIHCINCYCVNIYKLLSFLGKKGINTVITHHAEFLYTGNCPHAYECKKWQDYNGCDKCRNLEEATGTKVRDRTREAWQKMKQSFESFRQGKLVHAAVSPWVRERLMLSPFANKFKCVVVNNGIDISIFKYCSSNNLSLKGQYKKTILHVTASFTLDQSDLKGGWMLIEIARKMPDVRFIVVSMHNHVEESALPENIQKWGPAKDRTELALLYSLADLTLILSRRETYSMVTAESLCCGTPVVGFKAGGPESIGLKNYCNFVEYGDLVTLRNSIMDTINRDINKVSIQSEAHQTYSNEIMLENYRKLYESMLKNE